MKTRKYFVNCIIWLLSIFSAYAQDSLAIRQVEQIVHLKPGCTSSMNWTELILADKSIQDKINMTIRKSMVAYWIKPEDVDAMCNHSLSHETKCLLSFRQNHLASFLIKSQTRYLNGGTQGWVQLKGINIDVLTGDEFNFSSCFLPAKMAKVDTLIMHRFRDCLNSYEVHSSVWLKQLTNPVFRIRNSGLDVYFINENFAMGYEEVHLSFDEIKAYIDPHGPLARIYGLAQSQGNWNEH
ncbi:MAG: hypothetical protein K1X82_09940 [Bacteroidia bacterium]|nr:hypothetical protein [Bacteroidia bacterium]